ncbi:hypothetical protein P168DRAFT_98423 [Aspergillus campestris IBT 28561]|uniref:Uncharacterized protein n=1 Tax=Aspergillus campestris (strain IBT 28561) TaxID=1392248 RepID=A0A2I1DCI6_ASPC2|nr:uncharacterized protein P168DRAFT_98423 [Aspergillus campestris IBT 28561]PKY07586.1 hypothetical protein P168DRAFT_98423 [Aspergillus campestris IBT 28561]
MLDADAAKTDGSRHVILPEVIALLRVYRWVYSMAFYYCVLFFAVPIMVFPVTFYGLESNSTEMRRRALLVWRNGEDAFPYDVWIV